MGNYIYNFFWWVGGANRDILKDHIEDYNKYFHIGTTVFLTGVMAVFTGTFAANYTINKGFGGDISPYAILFGIFWGVIILNLDRFIVVSMIKQGNSLFYSTAYEKFSNFMGEFIFAVPRILLALLIAKVLLEPLELYLFKEQVKNYIPIMEIQEKRKLDKENKKDNEIRQEQYNIDMKNIEDRYNPKILSENKKIKRIVIEIGDHRNYEDIKLRDLEKEEKNANIAYNNNLNFRTKECSEELGGGGNDRDSTCSKLSQKREELRNNIDKIENEKKRYIKESKDKRNQTISDIEKLEKEKKMVFSLIEELEDNKSIELSTLSYEKRKKDDDSFNNTNILKEGQSKVADIAKAIAAKDALFAEPNSKYKDIHKLLFTLLLVIELLPMILKLLFSRSSYDAHIQRISEEEMLKHDVHMRELRMEYAKELRELKLIQSMEYKELEKKFKNIKFSFSE